MVIYIFINAEGHKVARRIASREEYIRACNSEENVRNWNEYRRTGDEKYKHRLVQMAYNCQVSDGGQLKGCQTVSPWFFHDIDCRDREECRSIMQLLLEKRDELGLVEVSESASCGVHVVGRRKAGRTVLECQVTLATQTRQEMDTNNKENNRVVFHGPIDVETTPLLDDVLFTEQLSDEEAAAEYKRLKEREQKGLEEVPAGARKSNKHYRPWEDTHGTQPLSGAAVQSPATDALQPETTTEETTDYTPANARTRYIFSECMKEEGVTAIDLVEEGGRHNSVKMILSQAVQLLTKGEFNGVLSEMMPKNWQDPNIRQLVSDFYTKYCDSSQKLTQFQKRVFRESRKIAKGPDGQQDGLTPADQQEAKPQSALSKLYASPQPPRLPAVLPKLVKLVTSQTPDLYKATVAQAMFPPLATYPRQLRFSYIDNQERELRINCLTVAETGAGKDTCIRQPLNHILADMKKRDAVNRERLRKFNEEYNSKASNKEKPKRPDDLIIQTVKSDITRAALIQRMDDAQGAPLYVKLNELEQWDKVEGATGRSNQFTNLKLADDEDNDFGADRAGTQSVTASVSLHLNWNANTTTAKAQRYFKHVMVDGPVSRLCLATIPEPEIGADIPIFGRYDEKYDEALKPYIDNLKAATGHIDCPQARRLARKLKAECSEFARLSQDRVFDNLTHRSLVAEYRKACLLYVANGMKWEKAIEDFCRWSLHYDLWIKLHLWGDMIRYADGDMQTSKRGPRNLLEQIKTDADGVFSYRDVVTVRLANGMGEEGTRNMLCQWKTRGYIEAMENNLYKRVRRE